MATLRYFKNYATKTLAKSLMEALFGKRKDRKASLLPSKIAPCIADIPASEDLLSVKGEKCIFMP